jgi:hypothetical protein
MDMALFKKETSGGPNSMSPICTGDSTMNGPVAYFTLTGVTLALGLTFSAASFAQDSANSNSNAAKAPSAVQAGAPLTKQHVDGGDLAPNTLFSVCPETSRVI